MSLDKRTYLSLCFDRRYQPNQKKLDYMNDIDNIIKINQTILDQLYKFAINFTADQCYCNSIKEIDHAYGGYYEAYVKSLCGHCERDWNSIDMKDKSNLLKFYESFTNFIRHGNSDNLFPNIKIYKITIELSNYKLIERTEKIFDLYLHYDKFLRSFDVTPFLFTNVTDIKYQMQIPVGAE